MKLPTTLSAALAALKAARYPEAIFGPDVSGIKDAYRDWAKLVHEDLVPKKQKAMAHEAFILLTRLHLEASAKGCRGTYGDNRPMVLATLTTKTISYHLTNLVCANDLADFYEGTSDKGTPVLVKLTRSPANNDLMKNEADVLAALPAKLDPKHTAYFPNLLDSFEVQQGKVKLRANVFNLIEGAVSLADVREAYPKGIDVKDAAWMWNRALEALHLLHLQGYVHANLTPDRFLIVPETHQGVLIDFCYARKVGSPAKAITPAFKDLYPPELLAKKGLDFGADLYMVSRVMNILLGADLNSTRIPAGTPVAIAGLLRSCWLGQAHRTKSAKQLHADFKEVRKGLRWEKAFRPFAMPATTAPV